jgi:hypothetical protein
MSRSKMPNSQIIVNRCVLRCLLSINDNHIPTSCTFYVKSIQVKHSGELGREHIERERDVANWGERKRTEMLRENGVGFKLRSTLVDFD